MSKRTPIVYDPGWIVAKTDINTTVNVIDDMRNHLRGIGIVQPPMRYPNRKPRESYSNTVKREGTSPNMLVTTSTGTYVAAARRTRTHHNVRTVTHNRSKNAYELGLPSIHDNI